VLGPLCLSCLIFQLVGCSLNINLCSRIIWLGDLNYRIDFPDKDTWILVNQCDWKSLLPKDQVFNSKFEVFPRTIVTSLPVVIVCELLQLIALHRIH
jgi:hypothetical protein